MRHILILITLLLNVFAFDAFIKPNELLNLLDKNPNDVVILDVSSKKLYDMSHVEGALHVDMKKFKNADEKSIKSNFTKLGIDNTSHVVIYYRNSLNHLQNATYLASIFIMNGFENVAILDGGYMAWIFENRTSVSSEKSSAPKKGNITLNKNDNIFVDTAFIKSSNQNTLIIEGTLADSNETNIGDMRYLNDKITHLLIPNNNAFYDDLTLKKKESLEEIFIKNMDLKSYEMVVVYSDSKPKASLSWYILHRLLLLENVKIHVAPKLDFDALK